MKQNLQNRAAVLLCGGKSKRMGQDKASMLLDGKPMLVWVLEAFAGQVDEIIFVKAHNQTLPKLPLLDCSIRVVSDLLPESGPVEGLRTGFSELSDNIEYVFACGCDTPLLRSETVDYLFQIAESDTTTEEIVIPYDDAYFQPLSAVYPKSFSCALKKIENQCNLPLLKFITASNITLRKIDKADLAHSDPNLGSLLHVNTPGQFEQIKKLLLSRK